MTHWPYVPHRYDIVCCTWAMIQHWIISGTYSNTCSSSSLFLFFSHDININGATTYNIGQQDITIQLVHGHQKWVLVYSYMAVVRYNDEVRHFARSNALKSNTSLLLSTRIDSMIFRRSSRDFGHTTQITHSSPVSYRCTLIVERSTYYRYKIKY